MFVLTLNVNLALILPAKAVLITLSNCNKIFRANGGGICPHCETKHIIDIIT